MNLTKLKIGGITKETLEQIIKECEEVRKNYMRKAKRIKARREKIK